jgi:hypothetical protein
MFSNGKDDLQSLCGVEGVVEGYVRARLYMAGI